MSGDLGKEGAAVCVLGLDDFTLGRGKRGSVGDGFDQTVPAEPDLAGTAKHRDGVDAGLPSDVDLVEFLGRPDVAQIHPRRTASCGGGRVEFRNRHRHRLPVELGPLFVLDGEFHEEEVLPQVLETHDDLMALYRSAGAEGYRRKKCHGKKNGALAYLLLHDPILAGLPAVRQYEAVRIRMITPYYPPVVGGTERQCALLSHALAARGHEVEVLTGRWERNHPAYEEARRVVVRRLPVAGLRIGGRLRSGPWPFSLAALSRLAGGGDDVWHVHGAQEWAAAAAWLSERRGGPPVLVKVASSGPDGEVAVLEGRGGRRRHPGARFALRYLLASRAHFVVLNEESEGDLIERGVPAGRIHRMPNGVVLPPRSDSPAEGPPRVLFAGRLAPQKRIDLLLRALAATSLAATIAGEGPARARLEAEAERLGLAGRVRFVGRVEDPAALYRKHAIFALPSRSEGWSNALAEAMAHGLACAASDIAGNRAVLGDPPAGLLVPDEAWPAALRRLAEDAELRRRLGEAARRRIEGFSIERVAADYEGLYRRIASS